MEVWNDLHLQNDCVNIEKVGFTLLEHQKSIVQFLCLTAIRKWFAFVFMLWLNIYLSTNKNGC